MNSITYLWLVTLIIWAVFFAYLLVLNHRQRRLAARLKELSRRSGIEDETV